jgi:hypothetical protein
VVYGKTVLNAGRARRVVGVELQDRHVEVQLDRRFKGVNDDGFATYVQVLVRRGIAGC